MGATRSRRKRLYGKYRGTVIQNADPQLRGRLLVEVPDVFGPVPAGWAEACAPLAGPDGAPMGAYLVPPVGTAVWVEFERGDPDCPIWSGCRWNQPAAIPPAAIAGLPASPNIVLQTQGQNMVLISDMPSTPDSGGIVLRSADGATIVVNGAGIHISNGKGATLTLVGPSVDLNNGALTIT